MTKRRLTQQQRLRIASRQRREAGASIPSATSKAALANPPPERCNGRVISHYGRRLDVESLDPEDIGRVVRCHQRAVLPPLVTGDVVVWERGGDDAGVVVALGERRSLFAREAASGSVKPVAANIDLVLVVFAIVPEAFPNLIDRYLVAIARLNLTPLLVLNKIDLLERSNRAHFNDMLSVYEGLGYGVHRVSARTGDGMAELEHALDGNTAILAGQSGTGKSSLINRLGLSEMADVGELSVGKLKGTHKTTTARLFHLRRCDVIDSPGIREFHLGSLSPRQVLDGFRELGSLAVNCRFRDCSHRREPGCAIQDGLVRGEVFPQRLESYFQIVDESKANA